MDQCCKPHRKLHLKVIPRESRFGSHNPLLSTIKETIEYSQASGLPSKCTQFFLGQKLGYECRKLATSDREDTMNYCMKNDLTFYVHCPYVANLAASDPSIRAKSVKVIADELEQIEGLPGSCVLHIGKVGTIEDVGEKVNEIKDRGHLRAGVHYRTPYPLLFEIAAGQGTELGTTWEEVRHLFEAVDRTSIGLCIDTQHAFASGLCEFRDHEDIVKLFDEADSIVRRGISLIHLNDSKKPFRSRVDRHELLGGGYIWNREQESLRSLIQIARDRSTDIITETDDGVSDMVLINKLGTQEQ